MAEHHGICGLITNTARDLFYLQQKDELYKHHPLGWSFFGGKQEEGETSEEALLREFSEELHPDASLLANWAAKQVVFSGKVAGVAQATKISVSYNLTLFEVVLSEKSLLAICKLPTNEGRGGLLVGRQVASRLDWIMGLETVFQDYLALYDDAQRNMV